MQIAHRAVLPSGSKLMNMRMTSRAVAASFIWLLHEIAAGSTQAQEGLRLGCLDHVETKQQDMALMGEARRLRPYLLEASLIPTGSTGCFAI